MRLVILLLAVIMLSPCLSLQAAEDEVTQVKPATEVPVTSGYFGGLPFYTAFHQSFTTRLLLLKSAEDIPELKRHLQLSEAQLSEIKELEIAPNGMLSNDQRSKLIDENMAVDEDLLDTDFYSFLNKSQRESLDRLSLEFDGHAGLSLTSNAKRTGLSEITSEAIAKTLASHRDQAWLPFFRYEFAAKLPPDHEYRKCVFIGEYLAQLNREIVSHLSEEELNTYAEWLSRTRPPYEVIEAIKRKAPLPEGLFHLAESRDD